MVSGDSAEEAESALRLSLASLGLGRTESAPLQLLGRALAILPVGLAFFDESAEAFLRILETIEFV